MNNGKSIKVGVVGGAGYTGGELLRILVNHPNATITFVHSKSKTGKYVHEVHTDLIGDTDLKFTSELSSDIDVLFYVWDMVRQKYFWLKIKSIQK